MIKKTVALTLCALAVLALMGCEPKHREDDYDYVPPSGFSTGDDETEAPKKNNDGVIDKAPADTDDSWGPLMPG